MAELITNSNFQDFNLEQLKTPDGIARLNEIIRKIVQDIPSDGEAVKIFQGYGTPEASITAKIGSVYMRVDGGVGTTIYYKSSGTGNTGWTAIAGGSGGLGDVVGPASATNSAIVLFDGTTGKLIKDSAVLLSSLGTVTGTGTDNHVIRWDGTTAAQDSTTVQTDDGQTVNDITKSAAGGANDFVSIKGKASFTGSGTQRSAIGVWGEVDHPSGAGTLTSNFGGYFVQNSAGPDGSNPYSAALVAHGAVIIDNISNPGGGYLYFNNNGTSINGWGTTGGTLKYSTIGVAVVPGFQILGNNGGGVPPQLVLGTTGSGAGYSASIDFQGAQGTYTPFGINYSNGGTYPIYVAYGAQRNNFVGRLHIAGGGSYPSADPTARVHIAAQTTSALTAPLKIGDTNDTYSLMTVAEAGSLEMDNSFNLRWTNRSLNRIAVGGTIFDHYADVGNVGTGEDDLYSDTLIASTLYANGDKVTANYAGIFVSSATATRRLKAYFGGTLIYDSTALSLSTSADWDMKLIVIRESSSVVRCSVTVNTTTASTAPYCQYTRVTGLTLTNTQILKITGEAAGVGAATDDIVAKLGTVILQPAA